jgi:PAS domain S-box-containing protein
VEETTAALARRFVQETLFGEAFENAVVGVTIWDDTGHYVAVNAAACDLLGCSREEFLQRPVGSFAGDDGSVAAALAAPSRGRTSARRADGAVVELEWFAFPTLAAGLPQLVSLFWPADTI